MEWWEVNRYLAGIRRRYHAQWETTRWTISHLANMFRGKGQQPIKPSDIVTFPWEKDEQDKQTITDDEIAALQAEMDAWNMGQQVEQQTT
jgi:hypothetical protein